ncbi:MAG: winged helix-turn-helix domain-containing protein [Acidobacteriota bacterium]|nr:winged helix-turn-helix domain-containing protein [Acidobacteriota bacterium]
MDTSKHQQKRELYRFGVFCLDPAERRLWREDAPVPLKPKQFELLFYFLENAGRVTKKSELLDAVWADACVEETTLARNVSWLRQLLENGANGEQIIETVPKVGYRFTAQVTRSVETDENAIIVEEQTVQYFRGEETVTIDEAFAERKGEVAKWKKGERELSKISSSTRLLIAAFALIALVGIGFTLYRSNFVTDAHPASGLNVKATVTVKNITVDATRETVDTGLKVRPGDIIKVSAMGVHTHGTDRNWTAEGDKSTVASPEYVFQNAAPWSLVAWIGTETDKTYYFQTSKNPTIKAEREGVLYLTINDRKLHYANNGGGLNVDVRLFRNFSVYAEDDDYKAAWGSELVKIDKEDTLAISGRGNVAYWEGGELYDLDGSDHQLAGLLAPTVNARSLIGKIGTQTPFKIGKNFPPQPMKDSGWLFLSVNDQITGKPTAFKNNNGEIYVDIEAVRHPEPIKKPL